MHEYSANGHVLDKIRQKERDAAEQMYRCQLDRLRGTLEVTAYRLGKAMSLLVEIKGIAREPAVSRLATRAVREYWEGIHPGQTLEIPPDLQEFIRGSCKEG